MASDNNQAGDQRGRRAARDVDWSSLDDDDLATQRIEAPRVPPAIIDNSREPATTKLLRPGGRGPLSTLALMASGVDRQLLFLGKDDWKPPYYSRWDIPYFVGLGGAVIATAVIAGLASTYAAALTFAQGRHFFSFLPFGLVVAVVVFNVDRFLVSDADVGFEVRPGRSALFTFVGNLAKEVLKILPRLIITLAFGFMFAEPLLLKFFAEDISARLHAQFIAQTDQRAEQALNAEIMQYNDNKSRLDALTSARDQVDQADQDAIKNQLQVIHNEQLNGNNTGRGPTCGPACDKELQVLKGYEGKLNTAKQEFTKAHQQEFDTYNTSISNLESLITLADSQVRELAEYQCSRQVSGTRMPDGTRVAARAYPADMPQNLTIAVTCPDPPNGILDQIVALDQLGRDINVAPTPRTPIATEASQSPTPGPSGGAATGASVGQAASSDSSGSPRAHVADAVWLVRGALIGIDVLPVLSKFLRGLLPKRGYYKVVGAYQRQVESHADLVVDRTLRDYIDEVDHRKKLDTIRSELRALERERYIRTLNESRTRLGLRIIDDFVQRLLRREQRGQHGGLEPPQNASGEETAPTPRRPPRPRPPEDGGPGTPDHPRSMGD